MARGVYSERLESAHAPPPRTPDPPPRPLKHLIDRLVAAAGLLITAPILAATAVALRLTGTGQVLVRAERVGERGRAVLVRSFAITGERCRSPVWRALAHAGVTALPQLWSVLRGEMSLVGPRPRDPELPPPPARPGLTGLAQLAQLERRVSLAEQLALDDEYARTSSLGLDARIMWRTFVVSTSGARAPRRR